MNKKNILSIVIMSSIIGNSCYSSINHKPGVEVYKETVYTRDTTDPKRRVNYEGSLRRGEPIVIVQDTKEGSGNITVYNQNNLKRTSFGSLSFKSLSSDTDNTHAYFTRCNGFSVIEERDKHSLNADIKQQFNPCENIRIKMAVKSFLKEELKKELETKKLQKAFDQQRI